MEGETRQTRADGLSSRWLPHGYTYLLQSLHSICGISHYCPVHTPKTTLSNPELFREVAGALGNLTEGPAKWGGMCPLEVRHWALWARLLEETMDQVRTLSILGPGCKLPSTLVVSQMTWLCCCGLCGTPKAEFLPPCLEFSLGVKGHLP